MAGKECQRRYPRQCLWCPVFVALLHPQEEDHASSVLWIPAALLHFPMSMLSVLAAQEATPTSGLGDLGLPTLDVTVTADAYEGIPEMLEAGRYLVTISVTEYAGEFGGGVGFVQPAGMTAEEFIDFPGQLAGLPDESGVGVAAATPIGEPAATPVANEGEEMLTLPEFIYESTFAGGAYAPAGGSVQIVLDLTPGEWVARGDDSAAP
jgi:hypothetical protein